MMIITMILNLSGPVQTTNVLELRPPNKSQMQRQRDCKIRFQCQIGEPFSEAVKLHKLSETLLENSELCSPGPFKAPLQCWWAYLGVPILANFQAAWGMTHSKFMMARQSLLKEG